MCIGIVGRVAGFADDHPDLALVDVAGGVRPINVAILGRETLAPGDWILIHAGFAMDKIDEETARMQLAVLREYTGGPDATDGDGA